MAIKKQGRKKMEELVNFFTKGEVVSTVLAVVIVILTSIIKIPIKKFCLPCVCFMPKKNQPKRNGGSGALR